MKANELRIGNWVKREEQPDGFQIDSHSFSICERDPLMYNPIPLTEEWLLKFGFRKEENSEFVNYWHLGWVTIYHEYSRDEPFFTLVPFMTSQNKFKYVHQLQNLYFALTGEELEIK